MDHQPNNPTHGVTLEAMLTFLVERLGWDALAERIRIRCFAHEPSVSSSLSFLRKTPWARQKVERLYLDTLRRPVHHKRVAPVTSRGQGTHRPPLKKD